MLKITVPKQEAWDQVKEEFVYTNEVTLMLEHSLLSISKWESKWHKCFVSNVKSDAQTAEEFIDYIKCMTINQVDPNIYAILPPDIIDKITNYIHDPYSATTITNNKNQPQKKKSRISSEEVYSWMVMYRIPFEAEKWHFNRLMNLITICGEHNSSSKNKYMPKKDVQNMYRQMNERNRALFHSKG